MHHVGQYPEKLKVFSVIKKLKLNQKLKAWYVASYLFIQKFSVKNFPGRIFLHTSVEHN